MPSSAQIQLGRKCLEEVTQANSATGILAKTFQQVGDRNLWDVSFRRRCVVAGAVLVLVVAVVVVVVGWFVVGVRAFSHLRSEGRDAN